MSRSWTSVISLCLVAGASGYWSPGSTAQNPNDPVQIGMMSSLFDDGDESVIKAQLQPFADLVRKQTGLAGEFTVIKSVDQLADGLQSGKLGLGIVLGLDYGWLRESCPQAEPLVIGLNELPLVKAHVLVHKDNPAKSLADLKGKSFACTKKLQRFARFYVERESQAELGKFFTLKEQSDTDAAIEAVVEGEADATVVSTQGLDVYRKRKPGRFNRLKVLQESIEFPTGAVIYLPGKVKVDLLNKFRDSMLKAHDNPEGRQTLTLWKLTHFEKPPEDFVKKVDELVKKYPREAR